MGYSERATAEKQWSECPKCKREVYVPKAVTVGTADYHAACVPDYGYECGYCGQDVNRHAAGCPHFGIEGALSVLQQEEMKREANPQCPACHSEPALYRGIGEPSLGYACNRAHYSFPTREELAKR